MVVIGVGVHACVLSIPSHTHVHIHHSVCVFKQSRSVLCIELICYREQLRQWIFLERAPDPPSVIC